MDVAKEIYIIIRTFEDEIDGIGFDAPLTEINKIWGNARDKLIALSEAEKNLFKEIHTLTVEEFIIEWKNILGLE